MLVLTNYPAVVELTVLVMLNLPKNTSETKGILVDTTSRFRLPIIRQYGGVAQLGEHLPCKQGVMGSNPIISTMR